MAKKAPFCNRRRLAIPVILLGYVAKWLTLAASNGLDGLYWPFPRFRREHRPNQARDRVKVRLSLLPWFARRRATL